MPLVQAFKSAKQPVFLKICKSHFPKNVNNFENFGEIFSYILYIYTFLSLVTIIIAFVPVNVYALKFGKKITCDLIFLKKKPVQRFSPYLSSFISEKCVV